MPRYIVNTAQFQPFEGLQEALNTYKVAFDKYDNLFGSECKKFSSKSMQLYIRAK